MTLNKNHFSPAQVGETDFTDGITPVSANFLNSMLPTFGSIQDAIEQLSPGELCVIDSAHEFGDRQAAFQTATLSYSLDEFVDMASDGEHLMILSTNFSTQLRVSILSSIKDLQPTGNFLHNINVSGYTSSDSYNSTDVNFIKRARVLTNGTHWCVLHHDGNGLNNLRVVIYDSFAQGAQPITVKQFDSLSGSAAVQLHSVHSAFMLQDRIILGLNDLLDDPSHNGVSLIAIDFDGNVIDSTGPGVNWRPLACDGRHVLAVSDVNGGGPLDHIAFMPAHDLSGGESTFSFTTPSTGTYKADFNIVLEPGDPDAASGRYVMDEESIYCFINDGAGNTAYVVYIRTGTGVSSPKREATLSGGGDTLATCGLCVYGDKIMSRNTQVRLRTGEPPTAETLGNNKTLSAWELVDLDFYNDPQQLDYNTQELMCDGQHLFVHGLRNNLGRVTVLKPYNKPPKVWRRTGLGVQVITPYPHMPLVPCY
ncbi:MAG: hypothetical protein ACF8MF_06775 [Phycisphaerales bacterium JB052]